MSGPVEVVLCFASAAQGVALLLLQLRVNRLKRTVEMLDTLLDRHHKIAASQMDAIKALSENVRLLARR